MDINRILEELRREREAIDEVILLLERVQAGRTQRRGRPPRWLQEARNAADSNGEPCHETKRAISEESRQRMAEAQRRRRERERNEAQTQQAVIQPE